MFKRIVSISLLGFIVVPVFLSQVECIKILQSNTRDRAIKLEREVILQSIQVPITITPPPEQPVESYISIHSEDVIEEYPIFDEMIDTQETIYDYYTDKEIEMIQRMVEAEATGGSLEDKMDIANVIYNRLSSDEFPDTVEEVIFQKSNGRYQFSPIADKRYYKVKITEETKLAVELAFTEPDTTNGALYFCNLNNVRNKSVKMWFNSLELVKSTDIGHNFYK